jgi:hypothetical protein
MAWAFELSTRWPTLQTFFRVEGKSTQLPSDLYTSNPDELEQSLVHIRRKLAQHRTDLELDIRETQTAIAILSPRKASELPWLQRQLDRLRGQLEMVRDDLDELGKLHEQLENGLAVPSSNAVSINEIRRRVRQWLIRRELDSLDHRFP